MNYPPKKPHFDPTFSLGNLMSICAMLVSVGSIYGIQQQFNIRMRDELTANQAKLMEESRKIQELQLNSIGTSKDISYIKETVVDIRQEQKNISSALKKVN